MYQDLLSAEMPRTFSKSNEGKAIRLSLSMCNKRLEVVYFDEIIGFFSFSRNICLVLVALIIKIFFSFSLNATCLPKTIGLTNHIPLLICYKLCNRILW